MKKIVLVIITEFFKENVVIIHKEDIHRKCLILVPLLNTDTKKCD